MKSNKSIAEKNSQKLTKAMKMMASNRDSDSEFGYGNYGEGFNYPYDYEPDDDDYFDDDDDDDDSLEEGWNEMVEFDKSTAISEVTFLKNELFCDNNYMQ